MKKMNVKLTIKYDRSKPDGMPKKCLDISIAKKYGYRPVNNYSIEVLKPHLNFMRV